MEISYGYFERMIQVYNVDESKIKAEFKDGILFIIISKS
jgi:HSP20 family molecular chaperone IbpA